MYRLPNDIRMKLHDKFPNVMELDEIINSIFEEIREKSFDDGSCNIYKFGMFYSYKAYSKKRGAFVPRLKFQISRSLLQNMINDEYILQRINKVMNRVFEKRKETDPEYLATRNLNYNNSRDILNNQKTIKEQAEFKMVQDEIAKILSEGDN